MTFPSLRSGTTISDREAESQAMWPGKAWTSGTSWISFVRATAPQTPLLRGISMQAVLPMKGPRTSFSPSSR